MYKLSGETSVKNLNFKLDLDYVRGFTKLVICLQQENSVSNLIFLWVSVWGRSISSNYKVVFSSNFNVVVSSNRILICSR